MCRLSVSFPGMVLWMLGSTLTRPGSCWLDVCPAGVFVDGQRDIDPVKTGDQVVGTPELGEGLQDLGLSSFSSSVIKLSSKPIFNLRSDVPHKSFMSDRVSVVEPTPKLYVSIISQIPFQERCLTLRYKGDVLKSMLTDHLS